MGPTDPKLSQRKIPGLFPAPEPPGWRQAIPRSGSSVQLGLQLFKGGLAIDHFLVTSGQDRGTDDLLSFLRDRPDLAARPNDLGALHDLRRGSVFVGNQDERFPLLPTRQKPSRHRASGLTGRFGPPLLLGVREMVRKAHKR